MRVLVIVLVMDWPWVTDFDPPLEREKSKVGTPCVVPSILFEYPERFPAASVALT